MGHKNTCRHVTILKMYYSPFAGKIHNDVIKGVHPKDIAELQELRKRLGLDCLKNISSNCIKSVDSGKLKPIATLLPNIDGTVKIGLFPSPI